MINKKIRMGLKRRLGAWEGNTKKKTEQPKLFSFRCQSGRRIVSLLTVKNRIERNNSEDTELGIKRRMY
jgi:hypothetical protein